MGPSRPRGPCKKEEQGKNETQLEACPACLPSQPLASTLHPHWSLARKTRNLRDTVMPHLSHSPLSLEKGPEWRIPERGGLSSTSGMSSGKGSFSSALDTLGNKHKISPQKLMKSHCSAGSSVYRSVFAQSLFPVARNAVLSGLTEPKGSENRVRRQKSCKELQGLVGDSYLGESKLFSPPLATKGLCTKPPASSTKGLV